MDIVNILGGLEFFKCLDFGTLKALSLHVEYKKYSHDEILFYENEVKNKFYYLLEGELRFYKVDRFDNEIFLYYLTCNALVSDTTNTHTLEQKPCFANAVFTKTSCVLEFDDSFFAQLLKDNIYLYKNYVSEITRRVRKLENVINRDVVYDGTAKVAHMLANNLSHFNALKKHEIAYELHMQPETLSRILAKMVRNELIDVHKNCVKILNLLALEEIYKGQR